MIKYFIIYCTHTLFLVSCDTQADVARKDAQLLCGIVEGDYKPQGPITEFQLNGQKLFATWCDKCHESNTNLSTVPEIRGMNARIPAGSWFKHFITNSDSFKENGDLYARAMERHYQSQYEHNFKNLSDKDIEDIYNYLDLWQP